MAGCDSKAVGDALKAKGLLPERPKRERKAKRARSSPPTTTWTRPASSSCRSCATSPRTFASGGRTRTSPGEWLWNVGDIRRPLYRLPELLAADPADDVFLVEGEKDADRLRSLGLMATTTAQGAEWLAQERPRAARRPACRPAARQRRCRPRLRRPGRPRPHRQGRVVAAAGAARAAGQGRRVSDWLDAGGTADELRHLAAEAPLYEPPPAAEPRSRRPRPTDNDHPDYERWNEQLHRNERGEARDIIHNAALILRSDDRFKGRMRWNELARGRRGPQPALAQRRLGAVDRRRRPAAGRHGASSATPT